MEQPGEFPNAVFEEWARHRAPSLAPGDELYDLLLSACEHGYYRGHSDGSRDTGAAATEWFGDLSPAAAVASGPRSRPAPREGAR